MKVRQDGGDVPGVPGQARMQQETITLVPHAPCHSDPEEELVTITTQATQGPRQARDRVVVQAVPGILVTDISAGARTAASQSLDGATLPGVSASDVPRYTTTPCVPRDTPAKPSTGLSWRRGVVARRGARSRDHTVKHANANNNDRVTASPSSPVGQGAGVRGDLVPEKGAAVTPNNLTCDSRSTLTTSPQLALPATPAHNLPARPCGVRSPCPDEGPITPPTTCSFCRRVSNILTILNLKAPLPHSLLEPASLLQCLGLTLPTDAILTDGAGLATLCQECHALLCEGDQAYHHLMEVVVGMKQRWAGLEARVPPVPATHQKGNKKQQALVESSLEARVPPVPATHQGSNSDQHAPVGALPVPPQSTRRLRRILPKPTSAISCGLCGAHLARLEEWHLHTTTHHRLSPRWRSPRLQAALKVCLAREAQQGSGLQGARCCPACTHSFPQQEEFVDHLRGHHGMTVDKDFLACIGGGAAGAERFMAGQWRGGSGGAWKGKEEEAEEVVKEEIEEREEIMKGEELIEKNKRTVKDGEQEKEMEEAEEVVKEEIEEREEIMKGEELIEKNKRTVKDGEQEKEMEEQEEEEEDEEDEEEEEEEEAIEEEEVEEEEELESKVNSLLEKQQTKPCMEECGMESEGHGAHTMQGQGGAGLGRGVRWKCRVCAAVFLSQRDHDAHKTATHPGSVRARRGIIRPAAPHQPSRRGRPVDGDHQEQEQPAVACQEGAIVILEGDGQGGVTHHRLQPSTTTEDLKGPAQQNTLPVTAGAVSLPCPVCTEVFGDRLSLVRHRRSAHPQAGPGNGVVLVECPLCGRRLAGSPALQHHMARVHRHPSHPPLRYRCRLCLCQCHTRPQLERHMRERHGAPPPPPPVQCGRCGKTYSARYIDSHLANMHGDVTRFPCAFCPMKFGTRTGLRAHVSLEHANTTWACQECPLQFAKYHQLRQHRLYVHSHAEHRCSLCPRSFKRRCDLTEHTKRRHQERQPQECSFCPKVYSDRKRLRIHLMRKHSVAWEDTLARGYARRQRENNCLRRRHHHQHQQPRSPQEEEQQAAREDREGCQGGMLGRQPEYSVVQLTEAPHPLADTISYIILEET